MTPSFTVFPDNQSFFCFGCEAGNKTVALTGPGTVRAKLKAADPWSFDWTKYEVTFNSRKNKELGLTIYLHFTKGTIWIDDVELIEVK